MLTGLIICHICAASPPNFQSTDTNTTFEAPTGSVGEASQYISTDMTYTWCFTGKLTNPHKIVQGYQVIDSSGRVIKEALLNKPFIPNNGSCLNLSIH